MTEDGHVEIYDYKTSKKQIASKDLNKDIQLAVYALFLLHDGIEVEDGNKQKMLAKKLALLSLRHEEIETSVKFELDEQFNEKIKSRYRDEFAYANFSEGEKMRIDLALLFTWRQIAKMKNSTNTNLLILDEIFDSSLDMNGTDEFLKILNTLSAENIFVISHKQDMLVDKFKSTIKFEKSRNFSHVTE